MTFINMKETKKERKAENKEYEEPAYPWGLRITLDKTSLKKLDLGAGNFKGKEEFTISAKVKVGTIRSTIEDGSNNDNVELQITDLDLGKGKEKKTSLFAAYNEVKTSQPG